MLGTIKKIKAVIFDMDGLMIDSEPLHCFAYDKVLRQFGHKLTLAENNLRYIGLGDIACCEDLISRLHLPITTAELMKQKQKTYLEFLEKNIKSQPGLLTLLNQLQKNDYKMAIASGSALHEIKIVMQVLQITSFFEEYCSSEEVAHGKPAPDVFLLAAQKLGVLPQECLVLEDAPSGIEAAMAAGMLRYAIPSKETLNQSFAHANRVLSSLSEVYDCLVLDSHQ